MDKGVASDEARAATASQPSQQAVSGIAGIANADECTMGVNCDQHGVCYADAHGKPEQCPRFVHTSEPEPTSEQTAMARQVVGRFYQGIRDHDYAKWVFDGHKDGTTGVQIALAAIVACAKAMSARQIHDPQGDSDD